MNIVLTGLRGSGKTIIGKLLSKKLNWNFVDLDKEMEKEEEKKISEIIDLKGWEYFRAKESDIIKNLDLDKTIIATGGGAMLDPNNAKALKKNGKIVYLYRKPKDCINYITNDPDRPPLTNQETLEEEVAQLYKERNGSYCKSASLIFHRTHDLKNDAEELKKKLFSEL